MNFGRNGEESAEVTWHGKRDEIRRGTPIGQGSLVQFSKDWLYLGGYGMKCDRKMEVAAIVSAMNPGIDSKSDSQLLGKLQQVMTYEIRLGNYILCILKIYPLYPEEGCILLKIDQLIDHWIRYIKPGFHIIVWMIDRIVHACSMKSSGLSQGLKRSYV